ncbi:hypothetical protein F2Q70_00021109 [Brassica cretica]|uniref:Uncharacterized protein n=1 Tax=Brassica cretica TaxID=69181 RepID=A0A8S9GVU1_BRACR|nr:hypothetical protein F2Q70_00021109 [Brassica cretica]
MSLRRSDPTRVTLPTSDCRYACSSCERVKDSASLIPRDFVDDFTSTTRVREPACLNPRQDVATHADHASGYSIPRRRPRVTHGWFLFDNAGKGTRVATPRVMVSSRFSVFVRAGTASRVARVVQAASELSVVSCQRGLVNPCGTTRVAIIHTQPNFTLRFFSNHNASKHLQSLFEILHCLIKTHECNMDP